MILLGKDFLGNNLYKGSKVVFMTVNYRKLCEGILISGGKQKGTIEHEENISSGKTSSMQFYNQMIKISNNEEILKDVLNKIEKIVDKRYTIHQEYNKDLFNLRDKIDDQLDIIRSIIHESK